MGLVADLLSTLNPHGIAHGRGNAAGSQTRLWDLQKTPDGRGFPPGGVALFTPPRLTGLFAVPTGSSFIRRRRPLSSHLSGRSGAELQPGFTGFLRGGER